MKAADLDRMFDDGEDVSEYFDWSKARRPNLPTTQVTVELIAPVATALAAQAELLGLTQQELVRRWIAERLA